MACIIFSLKQRICIDTLSMSLARVHKESLKLRVSIWFLIYAFGLIKVFPMPENFVFVPLILSPLSPPPPHILIRYDINKA